MIKYNDKVLTPEEIDNLRYNLRKSVSQNEDKILTPTEAAMIEALIQVGSFYKRQLLMIEKAAKEKDTDTIEKILKQEVQPIGQW